jgi:hypothetical protein
VAAVKLKPPAWPKGLPAPAPAADENTPRMCPVCFRSAPQRLMRAVPMKPGAKSQSFTCATEAECRTNRGLHPTIKRPGEEPRDVGETVTGQEIRDAELRRIADRLGGRWKP